MGFFDVFKPKSVLNTDSFDRRTYTQLRDKSPKLGELEQKGNETLPTFQHLMSDIWAGLYKNTPHLLDNVPVDVAPNKPIMQKVFEHQEFTNLREHTKLDEMASALGLLHMGERLKEFLDEQLPDDVKKNLQNMTQAQSQADKLRDLAEALQDGVDQALGDKKNQIQKKAVAAKRQATKAQKELNNMADQVVQAITATMESPTGNEALGSALKSTQQGVREDTQAINSFLGGLGAGTQPGEKVQMNPATALQLAHTIRNKPKLKRIAELAGRMKKIAQKKQKSKTRDTIERTDVSLGNDPARLLPQEVALLTKQETRQDFMRRFAEGKVLEYSPESKERLGKGPIVMCLDTSGSMRNMDPECKAIGLALMGIAKKQRRPFCCINFASAHQQKTWEFPNPKDATPERIIDMAEFFWDGGTNFENPLYIAVRQITKNKFKKADIVFITDGDCYVTPTWVNDFLKIKKEKQFQVVSVQLGNCSDINLKSFSDRVIKAISLFDDNVTNAVLSI